MLEDRFAVAYSHSPFTSHSQQIHLRTSQPVDFVDLTDRLVEAVEQSGVRIGFINVQALHTTTAIVVNEHEPLLIEDMKARLEKLAPRADPYHHDDFSARTVNVTPGERSNGHSHCKALFLRTSETLNISQRRMMLGRWQRLFLVELDGPQSRSVSVMILGR